MDHATSGETAARPFFSVIMPIYGLERYIADSLADVLTQTWRDFEVILVDDATPDRSIAIARYLATGDERVRFLEHPRNRGLSQARNTGMAAARGSWIMFLDGDDRYEPDLLEQVAGVIAGNDPDVVIYNHVQEYYDANGAFLYANEMVLDDALYTGTQEMGPAVVKLEQATHLGYACIKAYRASVIEAAGLLFEDDAPLIEDILFNVEFLKHAKTIATTSYVGYHYGKRLSANLTAAYVPNYFDLHRRRIREIRDLLDSWGELSEHARSVLGALYARYILSALEQNTMPEANMTHDDRVAWLKELFADDLFCELIDGAQAQDSTALRVCLVLLKSRNIPALLAVGRAIHVVRTHSTTLYTKVKSKR